MNPHCECTSNLCECRKQHRLGHGYQCPGEAVAEFGVRLLCATCTKYAMALGLVPKRWLKEPR